MHLIFRYKRPCMVSGHYSVYESRINVKYLDKSTKCGRKCNVRAIITSAPNMAGYLNVCFTIKWKSLRGPTFDLLK